MKFAFLSIILSLFILPVTAGESLWEIEIPLNSDLLLESSGSTDVFFTADKFSGKIDAYKISNGELLWSLENGSKVSLLIVDDATETLFVIVKNSYYNSQRGAIFQYSFDGDKLWEWNSNSEYRNSEFTSAALSSNSNFLFLGDDEGFFYKFSTTEHDLIWRKSISPGYSIRSTPYISRGDEVVYIGTLSGKLIALRGSDGYRFWEFSVATAGYGIDSELIRGSTGSILSGTLSTRGTTLYSIHDRGDIGEEEWSYAFDGYRFDSFIADPSYSSNIIYVLYRSQQFNIDTIIALNDREGSLLWSKRYQTRESIGHIYSDSVGNIYYQNSSSLFLVNSHSEDEKKYDSINLIQDIIVLDSGSFILWEHGNESDYLIFVE